METRSVWFDDWKLRFLTKERRSLILDVRYIQETDKGTTFSFVLCLNEKKGYDTWQRLIQIIQMIAHEGPTIEMVWWKSSNCCLDHERVWKNNSVSPRSDAQSPEQDRRGQEKSSSCRDRKATKIGFYCFWTPSMMIWRRWQWWRSGDDTTRRELWWSAMITFRPLKVNVHLINTWRVMSSVSWYRSCLYCRLSVAVRPSTLFISKWLRSADSG